MSETYKLVFRGEVLDGQHPAVVRKRLANESGFGEEQLDKLFSGRPVIVKREADTATAARFQALFKKAGARLRVLPADGDGADGPVSPPPAHAPASMPRADSGADTADGTFELLPAGSDLLREQERRSFESRHVDTGSLALEGARFSVPAAAPAVNPGPDVSHLSVAAAGTRLGPHEPPPVHVVTAPDYEVAQPGADLGPGRSAPRGGVDVDSGTFEVAPAGADLGQRKRPDAPPPPDTSHLTLK